MTCSPSAAARALSRAFVAAAVAAGLALHAGAAGADERILDFAADVAIRPDGALRVTERITVMAEGVRIKRGLLRDFPTDYTDRYGNSVKVPFEVEWIGRDGAVEPWRLERLSNGVRLRIGRADSMLSRGEHHYEIVYRTAHQLGFFEGHDELYWNVTGNGWTMPIDHASARVHLPQSGAARELRGETYTGPAGSRGQDGTVEIADGVFDFAATRGLLPGEGLTIVAEFPKGIVAEPSRLDRIGWWAAANRGGVAAVAGLLCAVAFLLFRGFTVGREPPRGPRFPRYEPPPGMSAAAVRFVDRMRSDSRCFAAGVLGLGARGALKVCEDDKQFGVTRLDANPQWLAGERPMIDALFGGRRTVLLAKSYDANVAAARRALDQALEQQYGATFRRNRGSVLAGAAIGAAAIVIAVSSGAAPLLVVAVTMALALALVASWRLMPAYTADGRKLQDQIDGLRQYMSVADRADLARIKAPEATPEEFAKLLPYALALDVEKTWADRFAGALGAAAVAAAVSSYYYSSNGAWTSSGSIGHFTDSLDALGGTIASASAPPGSTSGASGGGDGGGSSGGGGGGGGGDGW